MQNKKKEDIQKIGIKAYSLRLLKEKQLFDGNLYISSELQSEKQFIESVEGEGFRDGQELSCRLSNSTRAIHFPRTASKSFKTAYDFFKVNFKRGDTLIV